MANFYRSEDLRRIAAELINEDEKFEPLREENGCRIAFQYSDQAKKSNGKAVYADTERVKEKLKQFCAYDFLITFYSPNTDGLDEEHLSRLMYHELCHVGFDPVENECWIIPHDLEDFRDVVGKWGIDWAVG